MPQYLLRSQKQGIEFYNNKIFHFQILISHNQTSHGIKTLHAT